MEKIKSVPPEPTKTNKKCATTSAFILLTIITKRKKACHFYNKIECHRFNVLYLCIIIFNKKSMQKTATKKDRNVFFLSDAYKNFIHINSKNIMTNINCFAFEKAITIEQALLNARPKNIRTFLNQFFRYQKNIDVIINIPNSEHYRYLRKAFAEIEAQEKDKDQLIKNDKYYLIDENTAKHYYKIDKYGLTTYLFNAQSFTQISIYYRNYKQNDTNQEVIKKATGNNYKYRIITAEQFKTAYQNIKTHINTNK